MTLSVQFYHLLATPLEQALPALVEKAYGTGKPVAVFCSNEQQQRMVDDVLWTYRPEGFLPHGLADRPHAAMQPVCLSLGSHNPNQARLAVVLNGQRLRAADGYERVLDMFDGHNDDAVADARARWKHYQAAGDAVSYVKQQKDGKWHTVSAVA